MDQIRLLSPADAPALRAFLAAQAEWRLMMLSNLERSGIVAGELPYCGVYAGQFRDGELRGCLGLFWNGMVLSHAEGGHGQMLALLAARAQRQPAGVLGPIGDVEACIAAVGAHNGMPRSAQRQTLFALPLERMALPPALAANEIAVRRARADDLPLVVDWRMAALRETDRGGDEVALREHATVEMSRLVEDDAVWLAERAGVAVSMSTTIALAARRACVGGVWTPPDLRSHGYARAVVAGQLRLLQDEGVTVGILFTGQANVAAQRAYAALGFAELGAWGMALY